MHALFSDIQHDRLVIASNFIVSIFYGIINQLVTMMISFCTLVEVNSGLSKAFFPSSTLTIEICCGSMLG